MTSKKTVSKLQARKTTAEISLVDHIKDIVLIKSLHFNTCKVLSDYKTSEKWHSYQASILPRNQCITFV
jgi:hypothetical protein